MNPFSRKGLLSQEAFIVTLATIACVEIGFSLVIATPLRAARSGLDTKQIGVLYAAWAIVSLIGFFCVGNTFVKRWSTILSPGDLPGGFRSLLQFCLFSPLLSIWLTVYTLMYSKDGVILREGAVARSRAILLAGATFVIFHAAFLAYSIVDGSIDARFHLVREVSPARSLREGSHATTTHWLAHDAFMVHVYPYASPLTKVLVSLYGDFVRASALSGGTCSSVEPFLGATVANCYMTQYRDVASRRAFATPAFGILFESQYREASMKTKPTSELEAFAMSAVAVDNLITLIEPSAMLFDRREFGHPLGLLRAYGSPELVAIASGQDLQRIALSSKLVGLLRGQLRELSAAASRMTGPDALVASREVASLNARLSSLTSDPLAIAGH